LKISAKKPVRVTPGKAPPKGSSARITGLEIANNTLKTVNDRLRAEIVALKKENDRLEKYQQRLRSLVRYLQESGERARKVVGQKIYEEIGALLAGLKMDIHLMCEEMPEGVPEINAYRAAADRHIDSAISELRGLGEDLRPPILDQLGLADAIHWRSGLFKKQTGISCRVEIDPEDVEVDRDIAIGLYRILQGLLDNVARHALASSVQIKLQRNRDSTVLIVHDNGCGITEEQQSDTRSLGLISLRERARALEGEMKVTGRKNKGTRVVVRVPVEKKAELE
jgi:signal transduction histidine kinase